MNISIISKVKELRALRPIPIVEAKSLLEENDGDVEKCVLLYTAKALNIITEETGADKKLADKLYEEEKYDINRTISAVREFLYDQHYKPIEGLDLDSLVNIKNWIYAIEEHSFGDALSYKRLKQVIETMYLIPDLKNINQQLSDVEKVYSELFKDYNDNKPLEEFVKLNQILDNTNEFKLANKQIPQQLDFIKNEVNRHIRNLMKRGVK